MLFRSENSSFQIQQILIILPVHIVLVMQKRVKTKKRKKRRSLVICVRKQNVKEVDSQVTNPAEPLSAISVIMFLRCM